MYGIVYLLTNTVTRKQYIGQTIQSLNARFSKHVSDAYAGELTLIANAIRTHGEQTFTKQVLRCLVRASDLDSVEAHYINHYNTLKPNGYNERMP